MIDCVVRRRAQEILERDARSLSRLPTAESALIRILRMTDFTHLKPVHSSKIHDSDAASKTPWKFDGNVSGTHQNDALKMLPFDTYLPKRRAIERRDEAK